MPGTSLGLAWTAAGGEVLVIEAKAIGGKKSLRLTGVLGDVMKESAHIAYTLVQDYMKTLSDFCGQKYHFEFF